MKMDYPLLCYFCDTISPIKERKIYEIIISEILLDDDINSTYPHKKGEIRSLQICEYCLKDSKINKVLIKENRVFK